LSGKGYYEFTDDVTSDLSFVARGATPEAVFAAAAEALLTATVEAPEAIAARERRSLALEEPDLELLLLRFLNELIYRRDAESLLLRPEQLEIMRDGSARLTAELVGEAVDAKRHALSTDVKAATAYALRVRETSNGWEANVTLDV